MTAANLLQEAAARLAREAGELRFGPHAAFIYNPLDYAWEPHRLYLSKCAQAVNGVLFLGMNPGPFGMVQTGVPFGEVAAVRDWMGIQAEVGAPSRIHPKRPVEGFACRRSEVSGRRLWGLMAARFGPPGDFFDRHAVFNYCPLAFMTETGANLTPDKLPAPERRALFEICDAHLRRVTEILRPRHLVGIGGFATERLRVADAGEVIEILHPSPASPAANRGWDAAVIRRLEAAGVWGVPSRAGSLR